MKKLIIFTAILTLALFFSFQAYAAQAYDLSGNNYTIYILCTNDVGDFCAQGKIESDTFIFDGDTFEIESFEDGLEGLASDGEYNEGGLTFDASYTGYDGLASYEFNISGFSLLDRFLLGRMDITFEEIDFPSTNEEDGTAFFLGIRN